MSTKLRIDYVSDVACPWCAIGLHSLEEALRRTAGEVDAEVHFQPFELNPDMGAEGENVDEHLARKFGGTPQQIAAGREPMRERARSVGFAFNSSSVSRMYNTFDAHRLLHWAHTQGRQRELKRALFKANFSDDVNVADREALVAIAASVGLDAGEARDVLESGRFAQEVREHERFYTGQGIRSGPSVIINDRHLIQGGQPAELFEQALRQIAAEAQAGGLKPDPARS